MSNNFRFLKTWSGAQAWRHDHTAVASALCKKQQDSGNNKSKAELKALGGELRKNTGATVQHSYLMCTQTHTHTLLLARLHHIFTPTLEKQEHRAHENICFPFLHPLQHKTKAFFMSEHEGCVLRRLGNSDPMGALECYTDNTKTYLWVTPFVAVRVTVPQRAIKLVLWRVCECMSVCTWIFSDWVPCFSVSWTGNGT